MWTVTQSRSANAGKRGRAECKYRAQVGWAVLCPPLWVERTTARTGVTRPTNLIKCEKAIDEIGHYISVVAAIGDPAFFATVLLPNGITDAGYKIESAIQATVQH